MLLWVLSGLLIAFILLPLVLLTASSSPASLHAAAANNEIRDAILLTLKDAAITAMIATVFGVPLAYLLARRRVPLPGLVQAIVDLPLAIPHTVVGMALLFVFGRTGWIGAPASHIGISFYGTQWGIIAAMLLVSVPFAVNSARVAFESIDPSFENAARSLGATHGYAFRRVTLPLALRGVFTVSLNRIVDHILPTVPLVRVQLAGEPPLTALVLNRELTRLRLRPGQPVEVQLPADSIKALARPRTSTTGGPLTIECARTTRVI